MNPRSHFYTPFFYFALPALFCSFSLSAAQPRNVILFIGDGMGFEQVKAAGCYSGAALSFESLPYRAQATTYSANSAITDSAASGTALATGVKVNNAVVSMAFPGDGRELQTTLEFSKALGKRTGLITTTFLTHATPATFGAHTTDRNNYPEIGTDYLNQTLPNILFGGGANGLSPSAATAKGYAVAEDTTQFTQLSPALAYLSAQFGTTYMPYEYDYVSGGYPYPHLSAMVTKALTSLNYGANGFFLMVEGGMIDQAGHGTNLQRNIHETLELSRAVQVALTWAGGRTDTLILVTADHETGGLKVTQDNGPGSYPTVTWTTTGHTGANVPVYAWGKDAQLVTGILDNTDIHKICTGEFGSDIMPPVISGLNVTQITANSALVTWTTDEPADSQVDYGTGNGTYVTASSQQLVTQHSMSLTGLSANTTYYFYVVSRDGAGNQSTSAEQYFLTLAVNTPPVANNVSASTAEDINVGVTLSGSDAESTQLTFRVVSGPQHGALSGTAPNLVYLPVANFFGSDSFSYVASDGQIDSAPATVRVTVAAVNDAPAKPVVTALPGDGTVQLTWAACQDVDSDPVTYGVYRSLLPGSGFVLIASGSATSYLDTEVANGTTYYYIVRATDNTAWSDSDACSATPNLPDYNAYATGNPTLTSGTFTGEFSALKAADDQAVQRLTETRAGQNGLLDAVYTLRTPANPQTITSLNLRLVATSPASDPLKVLLWSSGQWLDITAEIMPDGLYSPASPVGCVDAAGEIRVRLTDSVAARKEALDSFTVDLLMAEVAVEGVPVGSQKISVSAIEVSLASSSKNAWNATAQVAVLHQDSSPAIGAVVTGNWLFNGNLLESGVVAGTSSFGLAVVTSPPVRAAVGDTFTFRVTNVALAGAQYSPSTSVTEGSATRYGPAQNVNVSLD